MDANFFHYSISDRFIQSQPCVPACMRDFSETVDWTFTKFHSSVP